MNITFEGNLMAKMNGDENNKDIETPPSKKKSKGVDSKNWKLDFWDQPINP